MGDSAIHALAGAVGGGVSMALTYPLVNLSTRAAVQTKKEDLNIVQAIAKTLKNEGLAGLYSGLGSSLFGIAITQGVYYGADLRRRGSGGGFGNRVGSGALKLSCCQADEIQHSTRRRGRPLSAAAPPTRLLEAD